MDHDPKLELVVRLLMGGAVLLVGGFLIALSLGFEPAGEGELHVPDWVAGLAGLMMAGGGVAVMFPNKRVLGWALAMMILAGFGVIGLWVGLVSNPAEIAGGIPLVSQEANQRVGQVLFTLGGVFCLALLGYGLWVGPTGTRQKQDHRLDQ